MRTFAGMATALSCSSYRLAKPRTSRPYWITLSTSVAVSSPMFYSITRMNVIKKARNIDLRKVNHCLIVTP